MLEVSKIVDKIHSCLVLKRSSFDNRPELNLDEDDDRESGKIACGYRRDHEFQLTKSRVHE